MCVWFLFLKIKKKIIFGVDGILLKLFLFSEFSIFYVLYVVYILPPKFN